MGIEISQESRRPVTKREQLKVGTKFEFRPVIDDTYDEEELYEHLYSQDCFVIEQISDKDHVIVASFGLESKFIKNIVPMFGTNAKNRCLYEFDFEHIKDMIIC